jgi:hypothetical protein
MRVVPGRRAASLPRDMRLGITCGLHPPRQAISPGPSCRGGRTRLPRHQLPWASSFAMPYRSWIRPMSCQRWAVNRCRSICPISRVRRPRIASIFLRCDHVSADTAKTSDTLSSIQDALVGSKVLHMRPSVPYSFHPFAIRWAASGSFPMLFTIVELADSLPSYWAMERGQMTSASRSAIHQCRGGRWVRSALPATVRCAAFRIARVGRIAQLRNRGEHTCFTQSRYY